MQRLLATIVVGFLLSPSLVPLAVAELPTASPHACCARKAHHCSEPTDAGLYAQRCSHQCCRLLLGPHSADAVFRSQAESTQLTVAVLTISRDSRPRSRDIADHSSRAPPLIA